MPGARNEDSPLVEAAKLDAKPAFVVAAHIGADYAGGYVSPIGMRPCNSTETDVRAALDKSFSSEAVQIQPQSALKANSFAWP